MKYILLTILLLISLGGEAQLNIGMGTGFGITKSGLDNTSVFDLQISYNVQRLGLTYNQVFGAGPASPAFFKLHLGYTFGELLTLTPYSGYSHGLVSTDRKGDNDHGGVVGIQLDIPFRTEGILSKWFYLDLNKSNTFYLFTVGIKGSLIKQYN